MTQKFLLIKYQKYGLCVESHYWNNKSFKYCEDCRGTGHCIQCTNSKKECSECSGLGTEDCESCRGTGNVYSMDCRNCYGTGSVAC